MGFCYLGFCVSFFGIFIIPCWRLATKGILFSGCLSVCDHVLKVCEMISYRLFVGFHQIFDLGVVGNIDELIRF